MNVLVAGGAGYIGSHAVRALQAAGHRTLVLDNFSTGHRDLVLGDAVEADLADPAALRRAIDAFRPEAAMHFCAHCYVGESVADPSKYYRNNVANTLNLLDALRAAGCGRFVFSSSAATYGNPLPSAAACPAEAPEARRRERPPTCVGAGSAGESRGIGHGVASHTLISEAHPQAPVNPYGWTKLMVEVVLRDYAAAYGLRSVALRYFNAAGASADGRLGERHDPETHLIPLAVKAAMGTGTALKVFGEDYPTPDGTCVRDYIHVEDLADAHVRALGAMERAPGAQAFNLGIGRGFTVREVIAAVERVGGKPVPRTMAPRRAGDPPSLVADSGKARKELGWAPRYADLEAIVETAWRWHVKDRQ
jgi:UDP-glucose 4-epimerase